MRVIAGSARGRPLAAPRQAGTRPTADKTKQALFSMLESFLDRGDDQASIGTEDLWRDIVVVDVYAGSGALGIEALSRGAARATFLESSPAAVAVIRANLRLTGLAAKAAVLPGDAVRTIDTVEGPVRVVLMDPPYDDTRSVAVAERIATAAWLEPDAILILEHAARTSAPDRLGLLARQRARRHGDAQLTLYARGRYDRGRTDTA